MNHAEWQWQFVLAAYAVTIAGGVLVTLWAWWTMRRAETRRDQVRGKGAQDG